MEDLLQAASTCIASLSLSAVITAASAAILVVLLVIICLQGRQKRVLSRVRKRFVAPLATERVKDAFESLRRRELEWLRNLPHPDQLLIETGGPCGENFPAHRWCTSLDFALCLLGLKPCVLIWHPRWDWRKYGDRTFANEHRKHVLEPWVKEFDLERHGYRVLTASTDDVAVEGDGDVTVMHEFQGASLFYNTRGPDATEIEHTFLPSNPASTRPRLWNKRSGASAVSSPASNVISSPTASTCATTPTSPSSPFFNMKGPTPATGVEGGRKEIGTTGTGIGEKGLEKGGEGARKVALSQLGQVLGCPLGQGAEARVIAYTAISTDGYQSSAAGKGWPITDVTVHRYKATAAEAWRVGHHFRGVSEACKTVLQLPIAIDLRDCATWTDMQVAECLYEAFGSLEGVHRAGESGEFRLCEWLFERRMSIIRQVSSMTYSPGRSPPHPALIDE